MKTSRRSFLITSVGVVSAMALSREALAADLPMLSESDPAAQALGYKMDATKVDKAKFPKYAAGQDCAACMLYQGLGIRPVRRVPRQAGVGQGLVQRVHEDGITPALPEPPARHRAVPQFRASPDTPAIVRWRASFIA